MTREGARTIIREALGARATPERVEDVLIRMHPLGCFRGDRKD